MNKAAKENDRRRAGFNLAGELLDTLEKYDQETIEAARQILSTVYNHQSKKSLKLNGHSPLEQEQDSLTDLPSFFQEINPKKAWEKTLLVHFWLQNNQEKDSFTNIEVTAELNRLREKANLSREMDKLITKRFIEEGEKEKGIKKYRITGYGKKHIGTMISNARKNDQ